MNQEKVLAALAKARMANPDMDYDALWNLVTASQTALPCDLGAAARKIQASSPGLSFEEAWDMIEREALPHLRKGETMGMALIRARQQTVRSLGAPSMVKAQTTVRSIEPENDPWPAGKMMLICGSVGTYVD